MPNSNLQITLRDAVFLKSVGVAFDDCEFVKENHQMDQNNELRNQIAKALDAETARLQRRGTPSTVYCFFCGCEGRTRECQCFPGSEAFGCADPLHRSCEDCLSAMKAAARHIFAMFDFPMVVRADSRRREAYRVLYRGARQLCGGDDYDPDVPSLAFYVAQADPDDDTKEEFQRKILAAFRRAKFVDFKALAEALHEQETQSLIRAFRRARLGTSEIRALAEKVAGRNDLQAIVDAAIAKVRSKT